MNRFTFAMVMMLCIVLFAAPAAAATTEVHVVKYANDGTTVLAETTVDYTWMEANLPVYGDGVTHYYHQGPVFIDDPDPEVEMALRWNPEEDQNCYPYKDMGAVKGTNARDLCDLVGGMSAGEEAKFKSADGWSYYLAYENIYNYSSREGPVVLTWYQNGNYPDTGYYDGMRMIWFADTSVNPWSEHVFGNWDWHEAADEKYWYYYYQGSEKYPTTTGISGKYVSEIIIYSDDPVPVAPTADFTADVTSGDAPLTVQFTDASTGDPTAWAWDFDNDGVIDSTDQNPSFTYDTAGTYTVSLTVTNAAGSDDEVKIDYITVNESVLDVLYNGTVSLTAGATFDVVAYNSGASYTVSETTPLGALEATGLSYDVTDKRYEYDQVLLLDNVETYLRKSPGYWYAYVNDVYKDGYMNTPAGLNVIELADGDTVEFYYAADIADPTDLAVVQAVATAAVKTVADIQAGGPVMDVLYEGTVTLEEGTTFDWTADDASVWTVDIMTPHGALEAAATDGGFTYGGSWKGFKNTALLDWVEKDGVTYAFDDSVTPKLTWNYCLNGVYQDYFSDTTGISNNAISNGDIIEFYYGPDEQTTDNATAVLRITVSTGQVSDDWTLELAGAMDTAVSKADFEAGITCGHYAEYTDGDGNVWGGIPLWYLVAMVDDNPDVGPEHFNFNDDLAAQGYQLKVIAGDGWDTTLESAAIARNDGYIVANTLNGEELPLLTESGKPFWPLQLKGPDVFGGQQVGNIVRIELSGLPQPPEGWTLALEGEVGDTITQSEFEDGIACIHSVEWTDGNGDTWSGVPLWVLLGAVDDYELASHWTFSDDAAATNYTIAVMAGDGYSRTFYSNDVARNDGYIVANKKNGVELDAESGYPIKLNGPAVTTGKDRIGGIARIEIVDLKTPPAEPGSWNLNLAGKITDVIPQEEFEAGIACPSSGHYAEWTDLDGNVWSGMPLWFLCGWVDDRQPHEFSATQAMAGYKVTVKAGDGYAKDFASADVAWSTDYIVARMCNGEPLGDSWPLRLVGAGVTRADGTLGGTSVGNIAEIELTEFAEPTEIPQLHIVKYGADGQTIVDEVWIDYTEMMQQFEVIGDGETVYRYQGVTMDPEDIWGVDDETKGGFKIANAVKGTRVADLVSLVGGMGEGTDVVFVASDGYKTILPDSSIYTTPEIYAHQGDAVLAWYADGAFVPGYADGMRLWFMPEDTIMGQWDMHESMPEAYWHYYYQSYNPDDPEYGQYAPGIFYPSCAGTSAKYVTEIQVYTSPVSDWTLLLDGTAIGGIEYSVDRAYFESALACQFGANHEATYTDGNGNVWSGMPLWLLCGFVDDADQHSNNAFNDALATAGYRVVVAAGDGYSATIDSRDVIRNANYIVANGVNGSPIPEEDSSWPLRLTGANVTGPLSVKGIASITLLPLEEPPVADFSADVTSGDAPLTVQFTDASTGDAPLSWAWDFDNDGIIDSTEQNPSFTYDTPGTYTVSLTVTNIAASDDEIKTDYITVNVPPVPPTAAFTADVTEGDAPLEVQFTDASTGDAPLTYAWDFDNDGTVDSTDQNPSFIYETPGTYTVSLTVTNVAGSDDEVKTDYITVTAPPVLTAITVSPDSVTLMEGESQQFSATAYDQYGTEMVGLTFSWSSSDETVGEITTDGFFTAYHVGTTTITATSGMVSGSAEVSVMESGAATPLDRAIDLEMYVGGLDLPSGITNALLAKLDGVVDGLRAMEDAESGPGRDKPGNAANHGAPGLKPIQNKLNAFINQVEALQGKKIPGETADELIRMAEELLDLLADSG